MLERLAERQISVGIDGLAVCTVTGEGPTLSSTERSGDYPHLRQGGGRGRVPVIAATGTNATSTTIALTLEARELRADAALVTVPYYSKPGQKRSSTISSRWRRQCDLPVIIDDSPSRCASNLAPESLEALARIEHPRRRPFERCGDPACAASAPARCRPVIR